MRTQALGASGGAADGGSSRKGSARADVATAKGPRSAGPRRSFLGKDSSPGAHEMQDLQSDADNNSAEAEKGSRAQSGTEFFPRPLGCFGERLLGAGVRLSGEEKKPEQHVSPTEHRISTTTPLTRENSFVTPST
ncbi:hypothetical protein JEQ12_004747 [Ovis aries]|uniref:Uncharacterized protein n=1 Tax=Ovis aries TaxID=9940 RepID=A0A836A656_SHEEP|nr:hypothetical protein JEQ12_004747 [Ovis aries]